VTGAVELLDWISGHEVLPVRVWNVVDAAAEHDLRSEYVELFWLPILGPSALLALRRLAECVTGPDSSVVQLAEFARCLGLGTGLGRRAPAVRALARLVDFHLARVHDGHFEIRARVPSLNAKQIRRLPPVLLALHEQVGRIHPHRVTDPSARIGQSRRPRRA
jgi:hypothetical protein